MSFNRNVVENVEEHFFVCVYAYVSIGLRTQLLSVCMHTWLMHTQVPFMRTNPCSLVYMDAWSILHMYVASLRTQMRVYMHMLALGNPILIVLTPFSLIFSSNCNFIALFSFWQTLPTFLGRGSTNRVTKCYRVLTNKTRGHIRATGFELIICLLPKTTANIILVQSLAESWWDTTHTLHIVD